FDIFISNIPYQYSNRIIKWLSVRKFSRAVIMVQREFANKLMAQPNDSSYSAISVIAQYCFEIESLFLVTPDAFLPVPRVESQVLKLIPKNNLIVKEVMNTIELLFRSRNRVIDMNYSNREKLKRISELSVKEIIEISMKKLNFKTKLCK
ncbi:MAG: rRNA adenine N-6-methyltransferase family protein, partial [Nitrososphaeraceae archaeon]